MPKFIEELVSNQVRRSEIARQQKKDIGEVCPHPVITISRAMGSGARIIAEKLAERLGWSLWDKDLIDAMAKDATVSNRIVEAFDEHAVSEIEALARSMLGDHDMGGFMYGKHLAKALAAIAKLGNAIILGRGAYFFLPKALNIRIDASEEFRVKNMMAFESLSHHDALEKIHRSDKDRGEFMIRLVGKERVEHARHDITIWMDEFSNDDAVEIIETAAKVWCRKGS